MGFELQEVVRQNKAIIVQNDKIILSLAEIKADLGRVGDTVYGVDGDKARGHVSRIRNLEKHNEEIKKNTIKLGLYAFLLSMVGGHTGTKIQPLLDWLIK